MNNTDKRGTLYLVPNTLGKTPENNTIPAYVLNIIRHIDVFAVENVQQAVRYLQWVGDTVPDYKITFLQVGKNSPSRDKADAIRALKEGSDVGLLTDAGLPAVADPGAEIVNMAHRQGITIVPLVGPSSPMLALMASGLGGQVFAFNGYLPRDDNKRKDRIKGLERAMVKQNQTQIFMEAPQRNTAMLKTILEVCNEETWLCTAANLTLPNEQILSKSVADWKQMKELPDLNKKPTIFIIGDPNNIQKQQ